jgi:hypothetical protein
MRANRYDTLPNSEFVPISRQRRLMAPEFECKAKLLMISTILAQKLNSGYIAAFT